MGDQHIVETDRLYLRELTVHDYVDLCEMLQDLEVMYAWEHKFSDGQVEEWLERNLERYEKSGVGFWAAIEKETNIMVGQIGLVWSKIGDETVLEPGYILRKAYWHKGFALEGAKACVEYAFSNIGVDIVYLSIRPENVSSLRVAEKLGAKVSNNHYVHYNGKDMLHLIYKIEKDKS